MEFEKMPGEDDASFSFRMCEGAFERNLQKIAGFATGDRITKPWFTYNDPTKKTKINGIFIRPTSGINCLVKWDNMEQEDEVPVSFISHA